jgi:hypothetical protein
MATTEKRDTMRLRRSADGMTIHYEGCAHAHGSIPWLWAKYQTWAHIREVITQFGYRTCKYCDPMGLHRERVAP